MCKKILALLLCAALLLFSGCSGETSSSDASPSSEASTTVTPEPTPTPKPTPTPTPTPVPTPSPTPEPVWEDIDVSTLPQSLLDFFAQFAGIYSSNTEDPSLGIQKEYSAENAADGTSNIMAEIVAILPCVVFDRYPVTPPVDHWDDPDPVGWSTTGSFMTFDGPSVDWIATNIFNVSQEDLAVLVKQGEEEKLFKRLENADGSYTYYIQSGGIGDTFRHQEFRSGKSDGTNYRLVYDQYHTMGTDDRSKWELEDTYYAEMEDKVIEGEHYWSMHLHTAEIPEDMLPQQSEPEISETADLSTWQGAYQDFVMNGKFRESGEQSIQYGGDDFITISLQDMDGNDLPELLIYNGVMGRQMASSYVFTYSGGEVVYCGHIMADSFTVAGYPGLFATVSMIGSDVDGEFFGVYQQVDYLYYSTLVDNQVTKDWVYVTGVPMGGGDKVFVERTDNEELYNASQQERQRYERMTLADLQSQGWDALLDLYE